MLRIGHVDSEGGPILLADAKVMQRWHGADNTFEFDIACHELRNSVPLPGCVISVDNSSAVVWDLGGAGTGSIYSVDDTYLCIIRVWLNDPAGNEALFRLAQSPLSTVIQFGSILIRSGVLAVLWAAESGECIRSSDIEQLGVAESRRPTGDMATGSSALLIEMPTGTYSCLHDEIQFSDGQSARRCHIIKGS